MIILLARLRRYHLYQEHKKASKVQLRVLKKIIKNLSHTKYANDFGSQFDQLPIVTYEDIFPYIDLMLKGKKNILIPQKVELFAKSSGTTNAKSKYIPTPRYYLHRNHYQGGKDMVALYLAKTKQANILLGKTLAITGSLSPASESPEILCGDVSALIIKELPWWAKQHRALDLSTALIPSWEEKMQKIVGSAKKFDIRAIAGTPTWVAIILEKIFEKEKVKDIESIWPNLEVFFHGAVSFTPYKDTFKQFSQNLNYLEVYNASEGYFAVEDNPTQKGALLLLINHNIFYEFIPLTDWNQGYKQTNKLHEVKLGVQYVMIISTTSGLYRYVVGDTVKFVNLAPYRIVITGRTKYFINAFGEEVVIENVDQAIAKATQETESAISAYSGGPSYMTEGQAGSHEWFIEFKIPPKDPKKFEQIFDQTLRTINSDYDAKRTGDKIMHPPIFHLVPEGTFYKFMERRGKLGGQHKVPPLSNDRQIIEEIEEILKQ